MALADPPGGAGRKTLIDALNKLTQRYAGLPGLPEERGSTGEYPLPPGPVSTYVPPNTTVGGFFPGLANTAVATTAGGGGIAPDGYGSAGWAANGVNLFNPYLARGDMANPFGPGAKLDTFGTPFWRTDYIMTPQGPRIKGEDGYAGDYPVMSKEELAKYGIIV